MRTYRASGLGGCIKAQVAAQLGFTALDTAKRMENMAREGALHELAVLGRLDEQGYEILDRQREVNIPILPGVEIVGHLDASTYDNKDSYVVEVKSMSPDAFKAWKKNKWDSKGLVERYKWQVSCYLHGMGDPYKLMFVVKNRSSGEMEIEIVDDPFYTLDEIMGRVLEIEKWVRRGELPDECSVSMMPCPFYYLEQQRSLELMEDAVLDDLVEMYEEAKVAVKAADERVKAAREAIRESMGDREKVETEKSKVTLYQFKRRNLDVEKMKEAGINVDEYWVDKLFPGVRVTVKERADNGGTDESGGDPRGTETDRGTVAQPMGESSESGCDATVPEERRVP